MKWLIIIPAAIALWLVGAFLNEWTRRHGHP